MKNELVNEVQKELFAAVVKHDLQTVRDLLKKGADVNACNEHGKTAFITACLYGNVEIVQALLNAGADSSINVQTETGATALLHACNNGYVEIVHALLNSGAGSSINAQWEDFYFAPGATSLIVATQKNNAEIVQMLLNAGADVTLKTNAGNTALNIAQDTQQIITLLQEAGAK